MHRATPSTNGGGLFAKGGSIFGGSKTPTSTRAYTSGGSPPSSYTYSESTNGAQPSDFSRKASLSSTAKSPRSSHRSRNNSVANPNANPNYSPDKRKNSWTTRDREIRPLPVVVPDIPDQLKSTDSLRQIAASADSNATERDSYTSTTPYSNMLVRPGTGHQAPGPTGMTLLAPTQPASPTLETITYQHIQEMASKRISTLDYLRKAHEGRVYWFNTLLFNKPDLQRMPYFDSRKLTRRATNYLLLGLSLPTILDLNASNPSEFLKALNALLAEFESFQQIHPPDGSSSSLSRARFPQMFKRATTTGNRGRRTSSAAEIGLPMGNDSDSKSPVGGNPAGGSNSTSFTINETELLPGEEYTYLLTPSLPFDPDFYETFATLCDVLIDCYTRLMSLVASPRECSPQIAEMFTKADARVRKIIVQGVVKEFEDSSRAGVRSEVTGVGRVVLGGLIIKMSIGSLFGAANSSNQSNTAGDLSKDIELSNPPDDSISDLSFSPVNELLAVASWDKKVRIYEISQAGTSTGLTSFEHELPVLSCHWSKDGTKVVGGGADKAARMIDLGGGQTTAVQVAAHDQPIRSVRFFDAPQSNAQMLVTGSWDKTIKYWDLRQSQPVATVQCQERVYTMDVKDKLLVVGTADRYINIINLMEPDKIYKTIQSPLKWQTRVVSCFSDASGFAVGSIEGRCAIQYVEEKDSSSNFSFKCHRDPPQNNMTNVYAVNAISFHPVHGTFSTAGSDGTFHFWDGVAKHRLKGYPTVGGTISATAFNRNGNIFAYAVSYDWSKGYASNTPQYPNKVMMHPVNGDECKPRPSVKKR